jgi:hypothetical protein
MIDNEMATTKFGALTVWAKEDGNSYYGYRLYNMTSSFQIPLIVSSQKYWETMMSRLYYEDCYGMSHFRLVYESPGMYYVSTKVGDLTSYQSGSGSVVPFIEQMYSGGPPIFLNTGDNYTDALNAYASTVNPYLIDQSTAKQFFYDSRPPAKYVKTFQVVNGATITGTAPAGSEVKSTIKLGINQRSFNYTQSATADAHGVYSMIVPYASDAMKGDNYSSDVSPLSEYTISFGDTTMAVAVPEKAVMNGETVTVA